MTINGIAGVNQYASQQNTGLAASQTANDPLQKQHQGDQSQTALNSSNSNTEKQAFKVDITDRAKDRAAAENTEGSTPGMNLNAVAAQTTATNETQPPANNNGGQQTQPLVNLIA